MAGGVAVPEGIRSNDRGYFVPSCRVVRRRSVTLRVVTEPSECFDGTKNVTFGAFDFRSDSDTSGTDNTDDKDD